ncbi:MAG: hypothetical protein ACP5UQ_00685 [Anaerolineae bacterium]
MKDRRGLWIALLITALLIGCCCALAWATGTLVWTGVRAGVAAVEAGADDGQSWLRSLRSLRERAAEWRAWPGPWRGNMEIATGETFAHEVTVAGRAMLALDVSAGEVTIRPGPAGQISVTGVKRAYGVSQAEADRRLAQIEVKVEQVGDKVWVRVDNPFTAGNIGRTATVGLTILVPRETELTAGVEVGRLQIQGVAGDMEIVVQVGDVILADVAPAEKLTVKTRVAGVDFAGALVPGAGYEFATDVGKIALRLPADSAFHLDARSDIGDVRVGFPVAGRSSRDLLIGKDVRGEVGQSPTASLYLRSRVGEIVIEKER